MKKFYLCRHEDVHGNSGLGVVVEGVIFDDGTGAFTWLTEIKTVTTFWKIEDVIALHSHQGRTEAFIEGRRGDEEMYNKCVELAKEKKLERKRKLELTEEE